MTARHANALRPTAPPGATGLYDPRHEHDSCGVGFVVNIKGVRTHKLVEQAFEVALNLLHRGACGCETNTGDGAGLLIQIPDKFFRRETAALGFSLPPLATTESACCSCPGDAMNAPGSRNSSPGSCTRRARACSAGEMCPLIPAPSGTARAAVNRPCGKSSSVAAHG